MDPLTQELLAVGETFTQIAVDVDPKGKVTECRILTPSRSTKLDQRACEIMRETAKFEPWRGPDRHKIRTFKQRVVWKVEE